MNLGYKRKNHLKSKVIIDQLFSKGKVITVAPFRLVYLNVTNSDFIGVQTLISVPKRRFKLAVSRNSIKRKISEAFRLNSLELTEKTKHANAHLAVGFIYIGKKEINYTETEEAMENILIKLHGKLIHYENEQ